MATINKNPLCDFRAQVVAAAGVKATATTTAGTQTNPTGNTSPWLVVQDVTACLYAGTSKQANLTVNLIDGTTGGTNVVWNGVLAAAADTAMAVNQSHLNIPCKSGFATIEFASAGGTLSVQSVAMGGYFGGPGYVN